MKIAVDIDNVLSNFNEMLLKAFLKHDKKLRNKAQKIHDDTPIPFYFFLSR